jgi:hypothetical protein
MKHKGIRATVTTKPLLNAKSLANLVENRNKGELKLPQRIMIWNKYECGVTSCETSKRLRVTFSKRRWPTENDAPSLPIGSKKL